MSNPYLLLKTEHSKSIRQNTPMSASHFRESHSLDVLDMSAKLQTIFELEGGRQNELRFKKMYFLF